MYTPPKGAHNTYKYWPLRPQYSMDAGLQDPVLLCPGGRHIDSMDAGLLRTTDNFLYTDNFLPLLDRSQVFLLGTDNALHQNITKI